MNSTPTYGRQTDRVALRLPNSEADALRALAVERGISVSGLIRAILATALASTRESGADGPAAEAAIQLEPAKRAGRPFSSSHRGADT